MATEKRLIRADLTVEAFTKWLTSRYDVRMPADIVDEIPTCDAVEVVRCKDCFANGCCSVQIDLDMGDEGYCPKGRKENR